MNQGIVVKAKYRWRAKKELQLTKNEKVVLRHRQHPNQSTFESIREQETTIRRMRRRKKKLLKTEARESKTYPQIRRVNLRVANIHHRNSERTTAEDDVMIHKDQNDTCSHKKFIPITSEIGKEGGPSNKILRKDLNRMLKDLSLYMLMYLMHLRNHFKCPGFSWMKVKCLGKGRSMSYSSLWRYHGDVLNYWPVFQLSVGCKLQGKIVRKQSKTSRKWKITLVGTSTILGKVHV